MSLSDTTFRHICILRKLEKGPATLQQIKDYYEMECEMQGYTFFFSNRTFLRDKQEILSLYKKDIVYVHAERCYKLEEDDVPDDWGTRITDAYNTYQALNLAEGISEFVHLERRRPQGMEHFHDLLQSIKKRHYVHFRYEKYKDDNISIRKVEPLALKEFESRWYLVSRDTGDQKVKTFALDRIAALEVSKQKYKPDPDFQVNSYFEHCFGIIRPSNPEDQPEQIVVQFTPERGKYIKSLPLHESQQILADDEAGLRISLRLYITHDFIMELLSLGEEVKVLQPERLRQSIRNIYQEVLKFY